ncbi:MAG TPA: response regulator, partial [Nitrospira sp.]|nr:response regulator [Nitrospira sp.]
MKKPPLKILLIEDDEDDYFITSDLLAEVEGDAYELVWISRYSEALPAVLAHDYDVCLIDYRLGEGDGIALIREARSRGCSAPLILLTG